MRKLPLGGSRYALVDDELFDKLALYQWGVDREGYAVRYDNGKAIYLHRVICKTPAGLETDHINGNRLDNRQENLRICTASENQQNKRAVGAGASGYKGVDYCWQAGKWRARIRVNGKRLHLGYFLTARAAAEAYDAAALRYFGEFAKINRPARFT